ncbi:MAG: cytochrome P450 [Flavobacteriales bacterium]|nr:cytochrome P450 [Flavobacteriales bacterium]
MNVFLHMFSKHKSHQRQNPIDFIQCQSLKGEFVKLNFGRKAYLLSNPEDIQYVLMKKPLTFDKSWFPRDFKRFLGKSILNNEGADHRHQRRSLQSPWMKPSISTLVKQMHLDAEVVASRWVDGAEVNVMDELVNMGLLTMAKFVFDIDDEKEAFEIHSLAVRCHRNMCKQRNGAVMIPRFIPTKRNRVYEKDNRLIEMRIQGYIHKKRKARTTGLENADTSVIGQILDAKDMSGKVLSDQVIIGELKGFFIAGSDPIRTLSWTLYELSQNKQLKRNVENELVSVLGEEIPDKDFYKKSKYLNSVFSETVRKYPHAWIFHRRVNEPVTLPSGNALPKDADIFISPLVMQRMDKYFPNPEQFLPERFADKKNKTWPQGAYLPFGLGPRNCIGEHFARMQASITLAYLCNHFDFEFLEKPDLYSPNFMVLQASDHVMKANVTRRGMARSYASE